MIRSGYTSTVSLLSAASSGVALFNLARRWADVGLYGAFAGIGEFYQRLFFPTIEYVRSHASWIVPPWDNNTVVLMVAMFALNAKSVGRHFELKFESEATSPQFAGKGSIVAQTWLGLTVAFAHFAGAADIGMRGFRITRLTASTITFACFAFMLCILAIPYVRGFVVGLSLFTGASMLLSAVSAGRLALLKEGDEGVKWLNQQVFARHYLGAAIGAVVFYCLNYASK